MNDEGDGCELEQLYGFAVPKSPKHCDEATCQNRKHKHTSLRANDLPTDLDLSLSYLSSSSSSNVVQVQSVQSEDKSDGSSMRRSHSATTHHTHHTQQADGGDEEYSGVSVEDTSALALRKTKTKKSFKQRVEKMRVTLDPYLIARDKRKVKLELYAQHAQRLVGMYAIFRSWQESAWHLGRPVHLYNTSFLSDRLAKMAEALVEIVEVNVSPSNKHPTITCRVLPCTSRPRAYRRQEPKDGELITFMPDIRCQVFEPEYVRRAQKRVIPRDYPLSGAMVSAPQNIKTCGFLI